MKDLSFIHRIDIELQSFCNRKCRFCPNKEFNRNFYKELDEEIFLKTLKDLRDSGFGQKRFTLKGTKAHRVNMLGDLPVMSFIGYQESLYNPELLKKRVNQAHDILGNLVRFTSSTNGDYLTKESLDELCLANLHINDYDCKGRDYWLERMKELQILPIDENKKHGLIHGIHRYVNSVTVAYDRPIHMRLENRGGYFKRGDLPDMNWKNNMEKRDRACPEPEYFINIEYNGDVVPCCHIRSDNPKHKEYVLGNIYESSIQDIYYSDKAEEFRKRMRNDNGDYWDCCKYCNKIRHINLSGSYSGWEYLKGSYSNEKVDEFDIETDN